jgi:CO dehydrogenase/acetyl-CoA synthase epsilon subunit
MALEYWLFGDIPPGPVKAYVITDIKHIPEIIKKYRTKLFAIGSDIAKLCELTSFDLVDKLISIAESSNASISTSSPIVVKALDRKGVKNYEITFPLELVQRVSKRSIELVVLVGYPYAYEWLLLNYLKHYAINTKTLSLEPYSQPNATWTLTSLPLSLWYRNICYLEELLKKST